VTIEARFTASIRSSGLHRDWTDLYRASSGVREALWKALYVQDGIITVRLIIYEYFIVMHKKRYFNYRVLISVLLPDQPLGDTTKSKLNFDAHLFSHLLAQILRKELLHLSTN
jgi:hypothetical protein